MITHVLSRITFMPVTFISKRKIYCTKWNDIKNTDFIILSKVSTQLRPRLPNGDKPVLPGK